MNPVPIQSSQPQQAPSQVNAGQVDVDALEGEQVEASAAFGEVKQVEQFQQADGALKPIANESDEQLDLGEGESVDQGAAVDSAQKFRPEMVDQLPEAAKMTEKQKKELKALAADIKNIYLNREVTSEDEDIGDGSHLSKEEYDEAVQDAEDQADGDLQPTSTTGEY
ncbi:MAG: hypothetical protein HRT45_07100 [Bdellovibrionales bacterium]|nr:hypothetical protein [Bdellovibrionales bacterium]